RPKAVKAPATAAPAPPVVAAKPTTTAASATKAAPEKPSADSALAARFNAWDKVESLEVEVATLKRRLAELEASRAAAGKPASQAAPTPAVPAAAPQAAAPAKAAPAKAVYHGALYTVHLASYLDDDSPRAARAVAELRQKGVPVWITRTAEGGRMVNRVRVGALPGKATAERLGRYINRAYDWPTWVTPMESSEQVETSAVTATQTFVRTSAR
ncbi:MAG: SPOR domain-containing protein, partial [Gemmatimonadota bacterium]